MSWWGLLPWAAALAGLWVLPGWWSLRVVGAGRSLVTLGAAPAATSAVVGVLGIAFDVAGLRWSLSALLVVTALLGATSWAIRRATRRGRVERSGEADSYGAAGLSAPLAGRQQLILVGSLAVAAVFTVGPMAVGMGRPDAPEQAWDAVFHLNATALVAASGNASSLGALGPMYGGGSPYYPAVWHAMAAIAPGLGDVPAAANAQNLVLAGLVWPLGLVALARACTRAALPVLLVPLVAATFVAYPAVLLTVVATWPYGLSVAVMPGALAMLVVALRAPAGNLWRTAAPALLAAAGVVLAHGSGFFSLILLAAPLTVVQLWRTTRRWWAAGRPRLVLAVVVATLGGLALLTVVLARFPALLTTLNFERLGSPSYLPTLGKLLTDEPLLYRYEPGGPGNVAITVLTAVGAVVCLHRRSNRWLVLGWLGAWALVLLAAGSPENPLRALTGFWYTQAARIAPLAVTVAAVLAALGAAAVVSGTRPLVGRLGASHTASRFVGVCVVVALVLTTATMRWDLKEDVTESVYRPGAIAWGTMLSAPELAMVERAREILPPDAVVLGDPFNGSAYLPVLSGVDVVFPQLGHVRGEDAAVLLASFDELRTDPAVCQAADALGVTHVYTDSASAEDGAKVHPRTAALRDVDTSTGFTLVDSGGTARLWRLDACS